MSALLGLRVAPVGLLSFCGGLTQGLVALSGLRTLRSGGIAPLGLAWPLLADRCEVSVDYLCCGRRISPTVAASSLLAVRWLRIVPAGLLSFCDGLTQGLVALSGLRTLGFEGIAPLGLVRLLVAYRGGVFVDCFVS